MPWRRAWQPTPLFSPGVPRGQRSLAGYSCRVCRWLPLPHLHHFSLSSPHSILIVERRVQEVKFPSKVTKLPSTPTVTRPAPKSQSNQSAEITQAKAKKACFFFKLCVTKLSIRITLDAFYVILNYTYVDSISGMQQSDLVIHIYIYTHTHVHLKKFFPVRLLQNIEQSSLCYSLGPN